MKYALSFLIFLFCLNGLIAQKHKQWQVYGENDTLSTTIYVIPFKLLKEDVPHLRIGFEMPLKALNPVYFSAGGEVGIIDPLLAAFGSEAKGYNMRAFVKCYLPNPHKLPVRGYVSPVFFRSEFSDIGDWSSDSSWVMLPAKLSVVQNAMLFRLGLSYRSSKWLVLDAFIGTGIIIQNTRANIITTGESFAESLIDFPVEMGLSVGFVFDW